MIDTSDNATGEKPQYVTPQFVVPPLYTVHQEGVVIYEGHPRLILDIPLWCSAISDVGVTLEWTMPTGQHYKAVMLFDALRSAKEVDRWLLERFISTPANANRSRAMKRNGLEEVRRYLVACIRTLDTEFSLNNADIEKAAPRAVSKLAAGFIEKHSANITEVLIDRARWTKPEILRGGQRVGAGEQHLSVLGRVQHENTTGYKFAPGWSLSVKPQAFKDYAATLGFNYRDLKRLLLLSKARSRQLTLFRDDFITTSVWVIQLLDSDYSQRGDCAVPYGPHEKVLDACDEII